MNIYEQILRTWCDKLLDLQIKELSHPAFYGAIPCPACGIIHGRISDAMYPMLYLYRQTGEAKYKDCCMRLFAWSDNLYFEEGYYQNDFKVDWRGITVFSMVQLGECLLDFPDCLDQHEYARIHQRFLSCAEYLNEHMEAIGGTINYPVTFSHAMAIAHAVTGEEKYAKTAHDFAHRMKSYFAGDGLLFGEGPNRDEISPKGCRPVDIGYNVEESLPSYLQYAIMENDSEIYRLAVDSMRVHLEFMLPDGAWDNSFGTRNYKWSYWGSRTSDGCQPGYGLIDDPVFIEAVKRNTLLLAKCTQDGLLLGGPMYAKAGEPTCIHHTFCHVKALAFLLTKASPQQMAKLNDFSICTSLPADTRNGVTFFPTVGTLLLGKGNWRASVTENDVDYCKWGHATGGSLTLLWHKACGPIFAASMGVYTMVEGTNMQLSLKEYRKPYCMTPRLEYEKDGLLYRNIYDKAAVMKWEETPDSILVRVWGKMTSEAETTGADFTICYRFEDDQVLIEATCGESSCQLFLPLITDPVDMAESEKQALAFHPVGGFLAEKNSYPFKDNKCRVRISVSGQNALLQHL